MLPNTQLPNPEKKSWLRTMLPPTLALVVVMVAGTVGMRWLSKIQSVPKHAVYHQTESGWQRLPTPLGYLETLRVTRGGAVWVQGLGSPALSRLEGSSWRGYTAADFGTKTGYISGSFVLDGEEVWATTSEGVLHWDGQRWRVYREAAASREACSIVAMGGRVWVIDLKGNLSHFESGQWKTGKVEIPGMKWGPEPDAEWPVLALTADGTLWLSRAGLWRFDGSAWAPVASPGHGLERAWLIGSTGDRLWLWDDARLRSISMDGKLAAEYSASQMGLSNRGWVRDVVSMGGRTWFAASKGILEFDGTAWRRLAALPDGVEESAGMGPGPDGKLWALGMLSNPALRSLRWAYLAIPLAIMVGLIAASLWMFRRFKRRQLEEHQRVRQAVEHATGEVATELEQIEKRLARSSSWWGGLAFAGVLFGALIGYSILRRVWPGAPSWTFLAIALGLHLAITFAHSLTKRTPKPSDPIGPGGPSRYDWGATWKALSGALLLFLLMNPHLLPHFTGNPLTWFFGIGAVMLLHKTVSTRLMVRAAQRCDYDGALKVVRLSHFYNPQGGQALRMRGFILVLAGRYREAEETLRGAIAKLRTGLDQACALEHLGDALMEQRRYDEAMRSYEAALHAMPGFRVPCRRMAELLLRQDKNPEQALEYIERMNDRSGVPLALRPLSARVQDDYWVVKAWALAKLGHASEVAPAIEKALKATNKRSPNDFAGTHYRAGMAMRALGNETAAKQHFKLAAEYDPRGWRGTLAKAELGGRSVWGGVRT
jgi:glutathione S-transferase